MAINKIIYGNETLIDLTSDTVTPNDVAQGITFHDKSGNPQVGSLVVIQPELHIESEVESVVTVETPTGSIIIPTQISSGVWECNVPTYGTYIVHSILEQKDQSVSVVINEVKMFSVEIYHIPDGKTVLPTNDIQIWLECAELKDKDYTTIEEVLADSASLLALMSNNNAVDYLVRSTSFATKIKANRTAMTDIGANNYCADTLLSDSTWLNAICGSSYYTSVLNAKVPTMTDYTTPSGVASADSYRSTFYAWKAFDGNDTTYWNGNASTVTNAYIGYKFTEKVRVHKVVYKQRTGYYANSVKLVASNDNFSTSEVIKDNISVSDGGNVSFNVPNDTKYYSYRLYYKSLNSGTIVSNTQIKTLQFYGRKDV